MTIGKTIVATAAAALLLAVSTGAAIAQEFVGKWKVEDGKGQPFEITLRKDGAATATQGGGLKGKWKKRTRESGMRGVVISWASGWCTTLYKAGDEYFKAAYDHGNPCEGEPAHMSRAEKVK